MHFNLKSKKFRYVALCAAIFLVLATPLFLLPLWKNRPQAGYPVAPQEAVFLELWNVDTFEGGRASRAAFLERQAIAFEAVHNNIFIVVYNLTPEQAQIQMENNILPDFVSFGTGLGELFSPFAEPLDTHFKIREEWVAAGENRAVAWCTGGYVLCSQEVDLTEQETLLQEDITANWLGFGGEFNAPLSALAAQAQTGSSNPDALFAESLLPDYSQYNAYEDFLSGEFEVLLGSQRDFYRLQNRVELGSLDGCNFRFLSGYTDLVQWLSVTTTDSDKQGIAEQFMEYVLTDKRQKKLADLGMFSVLNLSIYSDSEYAKFEQALLEPCLVASAFRGKAALADEKEKAIEKLFGV